MAKTTAPNATVAELLALSEAEENHAMKHPRYVAAWDRIQQLKSRRDEIEARIRGEHARIDGLSRASRRAARASALVHGTDPPLDAPGEDLAKLREDYEDHVAAVDKAAKYAEEVRAEISREVAARLRPAYARLTIHAYKALKALDEAKRNYMTFHMNVEAGGTLVSFPLILGRSPEEMEGLARHFGISLDD